MSIHNERLIVTTDKGTHAIKSATVFPIEYINETDARPLPPHDLASSELTELKALFSAATIAQRDQLLIEKATLEQSLNEANQSIATITAERDQLQATIEEQATQIESLQQELNALKNPPVNPRHLPPYVFLSLLKPEEIYALQTSTDPVVVVGRAKLQTIITYVDLDHSDTIGLANYMESAGLIAAGRAAQILAGAPPA